MLPLYQVDAFTARPFAGNPAAVCLLDRPRADAWIQDVAAEMNLSETAFLERRADGWGLRWFTPAVEVDLCGHATLASAHVLWESGAAQDGGEALRFHTRSGLLVARRRGAEIELDFPALPVAAAASPGLAAALGAELRWCGRNQLDLLVELASERDVRALAPDFPRLKVATPPGRGVIVTARSEAPECDFVSRFFAPAVGIDEDPVTGAAHCALGPYWSAKLGKSELRAYQASARGGWLGVRVAGDRVYLTGRAVTVLRGELAAE
jgi:predicted PhzF superfamily epimerase YddE/YHI9